MSDLGERRIVSELLSSRYAGAVRNYGDDVASLPVPPGHSIVLTTDPCPPPMAVTLGFDDPYYRGWLLATINLSDLAASGAAPLGLLTSLMLPRETTVRGFERLLDGIDACCREHGTAVLGGNLKEFGSIELSATAIGVCDGEPLTRTGASPGDAVVVIGEVGRFWAGALSVLRGLLERDPESPLLRTALTPAPQLAAGLAMRRAGVLTSCIDNSDGLVPSLRQLAAASGVRIRLEGERLRFDEDVLAAAERLSIDPLRLALGWGDWQLVGTSPPEVLPELIAIGERVDAKVTAVGVVSTGTGVEIAHRGRVGAVMALESERFAADSWFTAGLESYIEMLVSGPLIAT